MIRVLIVEDEHPTARAVAHLVEQHSSFTAAGIQHNGQAALEWLQKEPVDIVITDIRMPVMDGLSLLQTIQSEYPHIFTVVLSGYQQFDYAKAALEYQAFDYLLKPISKDDLFQVLCKLEAAWGSRKRQDKRQKMERAIVGEPIPPGSADRCFVMLAYAGHMSLGGAELLLPGQLFWNGLGHDALLRQHFGRDYLEFNGHHYSERIIVFEPSAPEGAEAKIGQYFASLTARASVPITLACHALPVDLADVGQIISRLRVILYGEIRLFQDQYIWLNCMSPRPPRPGAPIKEMRPEAAVEAICTKNPADLERIIQKALDIVGQESYTQADFMGFLDAVISDGRLAYRMQTGEYNQMKLDLSDAVAGARTPEALSKDLTTILQSLESEVSSKRDIQAIIGEMEQYLASNYNKPISNEALSRQFGFVPSYLSKMFRKYKGVSPAEYLLQIRIDRAKLLLETRPEMLVRDIANQVGYNDHHYFSKIFKRETGKWPTEFQKDTGKHSV